MSISLLFAVQFHFQGVLRCNEWDASGNKTLAIRNLLLEYVRIQCECEFPDVHVHQPRLLCFDGSPTYVTFRASIVAYENWNTSQLMAILEDLQMSHTTVTIQGETLIVSGEDCPVAISTFQEPECSIVTTTQMAPFTLSPTLMIATNHSGATPTFRSTSTSKLTIYGSVSATSCVAVIIGIVSAVTCIIVRKRHNRYFYRSILVTCHARKGRAPCK
jgi:hypothetical protein